MQEISNKPKVHIFVCCNERSKEHPLPSCSPSIKVEDVKQVKQWIREQGWTGLVTCTRTSCNGFCNKEGGVVSAFPSARYMKGLKSAEDLKQFVKEEAEKYL